MTRINVKSKKTRIIGGAILAVLIVIIILLVVPIFGVEHSSMISTGSATEGGLYSWRHGAYQ